MNIEYIENEGIRDIQSNVEIHRTQANVKENLEILNSGICWHQGSV